MNSWRMVGIIFFLFGVFLIILGFYFGNVEVYSTLPVVPLPDSVPRVTDLAEAEARFITGAAPYLIDSIPVFVMAFIGLYKGRTTDKLVIDESANTIEVEMRNSTTTMKDTHSVTSDKSKIVCGSCGAMNDLDAVFCKKCGKQFR